MQLTRHTQTQEALGGTASVGIIIDDSQNPDVLFANLWKQTFQFERQFSRFLPSSELSQFNALSGTKMPISPEFAAILREAKRLIRKTTGLFNPFILPALQRTGYVGSAVTEYVDDEAPDYTSRSVVATVKLELGVDWARIPFGTAIDLGGCGKGYLADQLGRYLREQKVHGYWIELSGDIATFGTDENRQNLTISVKNANKRGALNEVIVCPTSQFGIATSGTFPRVSQVGTLRGHHIIDPKTGKPAKTDLKLATVCASSAVDADVYASCAIIVGAKAAPAMLEAHAIKSWALQTSSGVSYHGSHIHSLTSEVTNA